MTRLISLGLVAAVVFGLSGCDIGPVVLQGTLTHADTGEVLADVPVRVYSSTEETVVARGRTGEDGTYPCRSILSYGCYEIELPAGDVYAVHSIDLFDWGDDGDGGFAIELPSEGRRVDLAETLFAGLCGRVVDGSGTPIVGARVSAIPVDTPRPPHLQESTTGADGTFGLQVEPSSPHWLLLVGSDGALTLAGMVDGDPATATVFSAGVFEYLDVGGIPLVP